MQLTDQEKVALGDSKESKGVGSQQQIEVDTLIILDSDQTLTQSHVNNIVGVMMDKGRFVYAKSTGAQDWESLIVRYHTTGKRVLLNRTSDNKPLPKKPDVTPTDLDKINGPVQVFSFTQQEITQKLGRDPTSQEIEQAMLTKAINTITPLLSLTSTPEDCKAEIGRLLENGCAIAIASWMAKPLKEQFLPRLLREKMQLSDDVANQIYIDLLANEKEGSKNPAIQRCCEPSPDKPYRLRPGAKIFLIDDSSKNVNAVNNPDANFAQWTKTSSFSVQAFLATEDEPAFEITKSIGQSYTEDTSHTQMSPDSSFPVDTEEDSYTKLSPQGSPRGHSAFFSRAAVRQEQTTVVGDVDSTNVNEAKGEAKRGRPSLKVNVSKPNLGPIADGGSPLTDASVSVDDTAPRKLNIPALVEGNGIGVVEGGNEVFSSAPGQ